MFKKIKLTLLLTAVMVFIHACGGKKVQVIDGQSFQAKTEDTAKNDKSFVVDGLELLNPKATYLVGEKIEFRANLALNVQLVSGLSLTSNVGSVLLDFKWGDNDRQASCENNNESSVLLCTYIVQASDSSGKIVPSKLTIVTASGNIVITLTKEKVKTIEADVVVSKSSVTVASVTLIDLKSSYQVGELIQFEVLFSDQVSLTGPATLPFKIGTVERQANCQVKPKAVRALQCDYTLQLGDSSAQISLISSGLASSSISSGSKLVAQTFSKLILDQMKSNLVIHTSSSSTPMPGDAANIAFVDSSIRFGVAGTMLNTPVTVLVTDSGANPVAGVIVVWQISSGGGSLSSITSISAADGVATSPSFLCPNIAGDTVILATISHQSATITVTTTAGTLATLSAYTTSSQNAVTGQSPSQPLTILAQDAFGNPLANTAIDFTIDSGNGSLASTNSILTNSDGLATSPTFTTAENTTLVRAAAHLDASKYVVFTIIGSSLVGWSSDLKAYWKMDEISPGQVVGGMDILDLSGMANHALSAGGMIFGQNGKAGKAPIFNGVDTFFSAPLLTSATASITMSAWFRTDDYTQAGQMIIYNGSDFAANGYGIALNAEWDTSGELMILFGGLAWFNSGAFIQDTNWHHVVLVLDENSQPQLYLDGQSVFTTSISSGPQTPTSYTEIGRDDYPTIRHFKGQIDEVSFWTTALSSSEVARIYSHVSLNIGDQFISVSDQDNQSAIVGSTLSPLVVAVADVNNTPLAGQTITWSVVSGSATLASSQSITDSQGIASSPTVTLGTQSGIVSIRALLASGRSVLFSATATPGPVDSIQAYQSAATGGVTGGLAALSEAIVTDVYANPLAGLTVNWQVISGDGTLASATSVTNSNGLASMPALTMGTATTTVSASVSNSSIASATFTATIQAGTPGDLDPSFGTAGIASITIASGPGSKANAIAVQADQKILVLGRAPNMDIVLARLTNNGSLDSTFANGGQIVIATNQTCNSCSGQALLVQSNGEILTASFSDGWKILYSKHNSDGSLDQNFGTNGILLTNDVSFNMWIYSLAFQSDSKLLLGGYSWGQQLIIGLGRTAAFTETPDSAFGTNGFMTHTFDPNITQVNGAISPQADGSIFINSLFDHGGVSGISSAAVKINAAGIVDTTFNSTGYLFLAGIASFGINAFTVQNDGKFLTSWYGGQSDCYVTRNTETGALDTGFGSNGTIAVSSSVNALHVGSSTILFSTSNSTGFEIQRRFK